MMAEGDALSRFVVAAGKYAPERPHVDAVAFRWVLTLPSYEDEAWLDQDIMVFASRDAFVAFVERACEQSPLHLLGNRWALAATVTFGLSGADVTLAAHPGRCWVSKRNGAGDFDVLQVEQVMEMASPRERRDILLIEHKLSQLMKHVYAARN